MKSFYKILCLFLSTDTETNRISNTFNMKININILTFLLLVAVNINVTAQEQVSTLNKDVQQKINKIDKQYFIENKGQWPSEVLYLTQHGGLNTWITTKGMLYEYYKTEEIKDKSASPDAVPDKFKHQAYNRWGHRVSYKLLGNNVLLNTQGKQKQEEYYNYFIGNDPSKHTSNVGLYKEALVKEIYSGIDLRYYFDKGLLRYDYIVRPGADPSQIRFSIEGSDKTFLNERGELIFTTCFGEVKNADLYSYQQEDKSPVVAEFTKQGDSWSIALGSYNKSQTLIIDPLIYSTYIGGGANEAGESIALDALGNSYITGHTNSIDYDTTLGVFQSNNVSVGSWDIFVSKLNASGTALIYSTYIGGNAEDIAYSITLDASGNSYITGSTKSINYPITAGAFQSSNEFLWDIFVTKLNATGTALIYSTYIGGGGRDEGSSIAVDTSGNAYITGYTESSNYDITPGAFQTTYAGSRDVFISKLNATGTTLLYSTFIGGGNFEEGYSIALDALDNAYITGYTESSTYDITPGAFQTIYEGNKDVFVSKLNATGTALIYSTYIGGSSYDEGYSITLDASKNAYITGSTGSINYDITSGAYQTIKAGGVRDIFVTKLNATGTALLYSTFIGGSAGDYGYSITLDAMDNAYIAGTTISTNYPITSGAIQTAKEGSLDVFVSKLNATGTALLYSTYIGGILEDQANSITNDTSGFIYITGYTRSYDFDITSGVYQPTLDNQSWDVFVSKMCLFNTSSIILSSAPSTTNQNLCINTVMDNVIYTTVGATGVTFIGLPAGISGNWVSNVVSISGTPMESGIFNYSVNLGCETATGTIIVNPVSASIDNIVACDSILWIDGNTYTSSTITPTITLTNATGCDSIATLNLTINNSNIYIDIQTACDSLTWIDGNTYTSSITTPTVTFTNSLGCDSIVTLNLTINSNADTDIQTACDSYTWIDGNTYTSSTSLPTVTLTNSLGCDSLVTLNLTINSNAGIDIQTACDSYTWLNGNTYTSSTSAPIVTLTNSLGCDSIVTLNLTILTPTKTTQNFIECQGYSLTVGTNTYTTTGIYTDVINDCDTIITNLTIKAAPQFTFIKEDDNCGAHIGSVLVNVTSFIPPVTYTWNTGSNDSVINNLLAGTYTVSVNDGSNCSKSEAINVVDLQLGCDLFIPNVFTPNRDGHNDEFLIQFKGVEFISLEIYDRWGVKLFESTQKNRGWDGRTNTGSKVTDGTYFFIITYKKSDETMVKKGTLTLLR